MTLTQERETGRHPELGEFFLATHSKKSRSEDGTTRLVATEEVQSRAVTTKYLRYEIITFIFISLK